MNPKYLAWVRENVPEETHGMCGPICHEMQEAFPELKPVWGQYTDPHGRQSPHWWLHDEEGNVVDPTASQFMPGGTYSVGQEFEHVELIPTGKCLDCGRLCYEWAEFCSPECESDFRRSVL